MATFKVPIVILSGNDNFVAWNKFVLKSMNGFAEVGKSLSSKIRYIVPYPSVTDMLLMPDGSQSIYTAYDTVDAVVDPTNPTIILVPAHLSSAGISSYRHAVSVAYPALISAHNSWSNKVAMFLQDHLSVDVLSNLMKSTIFRDALYHSPASDAYTMFFEICSLYGVGTRRSKVSHLQKFLTLKQGVTSHARFIDNLKDGEDTTVSNYCFECPNCQVVSPAIAIADLTEMIYLQGIDSDFYWKLNSPSLMLVEEFLYGI